MQDRATIERVQNFHGSVEIDKIHRRHDSRAVRPELLPELCQEVVYIDNELNEFTAPVVQFDGTNDIAFFSLPETLFRKTETDDTGTVTKVKWEGQGKVSIDCNGYFDTIDDFDTNPAHLIENGLEVIRAIIFNVYKKNFTDSFYDITTWNLFEPIAYDIQLFLNRPISVQKQIEEIQSTQLGKFIYDQNLRFSFDNDDFISVAFDIPKEEFFGENFIPKFKSDPTQVLNTYRVGFNKKWAVDDE